MSKEAAEQRLQEANEAVAAAHEEARRAKEELDEYLIEEEVEKQAVYFDISEDEARERIEQNQRERAEGQPRTIWPAPSNASNGRGA
jgi:hypothetical protein